MSAPCVNFASSHVSLSLYACVRPHLVSGVAEGLTHRELIIFILLVETEGEAQHVGIIVGGRPVIVYFISIEKNDIRFCSPVVKNVTARHPLPPRPRKRRRKNNSGREKFTRYINFLPMGLKVCQVCRHNQVLVSIFFSSKCPPR